MSGPLLLSELLNVRLRICTEGQKVLCMLSALAPCMQACLFIKCRMKSYNAFCYKVANQSSLIGVAWR